MGGGGGKGRDTASVCYTAGLTRGSHLYVPCRNVCDRDQN